MDKTSPIPKPVDPQVEALSNALQVALATGDSETASMIMDRLDTLEKKQRMDTRASESAVDREQRRSAAINRNIVREAVATAKKRAIAQGLPATSAKITADDYTNARTLVENRIGRPLSSNEALASRSLLDAKVSALDAVAARSAPPPLPAAPRPAQPRGLDQMLSMTPGPVNRMAPSPSQLQILNPAMPQ